MTSPIQCLNHDILLLIFLTLKDISDGRISELRSALAVSQVCSHWRTVAVEHCPRLWATHALHLRHSDNSNQFTEWPEEAGNLSEVGKELVRRSKDIGLEFSWDDEEDMPHPGAELELLVPYSAQLRSLRLRYPKGWRKESKKGVEALKSFKVPGLEFLELSSFEVPFHTTIFSGDLSSLVSLVLHNALLDIEKMRIGQALTSLRVVLSTWTFAVDDHCRFVRPWFPIFAETPNLKSLQLHLVASIHQEEDDVTTKASDVTLPHLAHLDLQLSRYQLKDFLDSVTFPICREVHMHFPFTDETVQARDPTLIRHHVHRVAMRYFALGPSELTLWVSPQTSSIILSSEKAARSELWLQVPHASYHANPTRARVRAILDALLTIENGITSLRLGEISSMLEPSEVLEFMKKLYGLRELKISREGLEMLRLANGQDSWWESEEDILLQGFGDLRITLQDARSMERGLTS